MIAKSVEFDPSRRSESGLALLVVALSLLTLLGFLALAIDGGFLLNRHLKLQAAYDAAALRASFALYAGESNTAKVTALARGIVRANLTAQGAERSVADSVATATTVSYSNNNTKVTVSGKMEQRFWLAQILPGMGKSSMVGARSIAAFDSQPATTPTPAIDNIVVIADTSDSMTLTYSNTAVDYVDDHGVTHQSKTRSGALVSVVQSLIRQLDGQRLAIVKFDLSCETILPPTIISDQHTGMTVGGVSVTNRQAALAASAKLMQTHLHTNITCGLAMAAPLIANLPQPRSALLLTDGQPTTATTNPDTYLSAIEAATGVTCTLSLQQSRTVNVSNFIRSLQTKLNVIGIGGVDSETTYDPTFLKVLAADPAAATAYPCIPGMPLGAIPNPRGKFSEALNPAQLYGAVNSILTPGANIPSGPRRRDS